MRLSGVTFWEILFVVSISAPLAFAQSYSAGGGSTPGTSTNNATAVCGGSCTAQGVFSSAYGDRSTASGVGSSASGFISTASGSSSSAYGVSSRASGIGSSAYGIGSTASGTGSSAYGAGSTATGADSSAYGTFSMASGDASVAFGNNANASAPNSVALGAGSVANQANTVSVGASGSERRITNVAPGVNPTDAVNVSQFSGLSNDVSALHRDIGNVASSAYRGIAGVAALTAGVPAAPGKTFINFGVGAYRGYAAGAITASHTTENGRFNFNGGVG